jgi:iron(III) transport system substrate-binding protein
VKRFVLPVIVVFAALSAVLTACGGSDDATLTVYSGREEEIVAPLFDRFEQETGISVDVRYGDSAELVAQILEEGDNSPADVFFAQDAGSLGSLSDRLSELPDAELSRVPAAYRDPDGRWVGTSGRVRVVAYNTDKYTDGQLPDNVSGFLDDRFKGRIGYAPTNASFQAFITAMRLSAGEDETRAWLQGLKDSGAKPYEKNLQIVEAIASGEIDVGFVNHYYLALVKAEQPNAPVANHFMGPGDPGALVNVAGVGVMAGTSRSEDANRFVSFLLADENQRFYAEDASESEYPLVVGIEPQAGLPPLESLKGPDVPLEALGDELEKTLTLLSEVGITA